MSWNNVIPVELVRKPTGDNPAPERKEIENPRVDIPEHLVTDCLIRYQFEGHYGVTAAQEDHPAFAEVRRLLKSRGFIEIPAYPCWNGDRVLRRFQFNGMQLEVGETFYCAAAWNNRIKVNKTKQMIEDN